MGLTDEELHLISEFTVFDWVEERAKVVAALSRHRPGYMSQAAHELEGIFGELARALTRMPCGHPRGCIVASDEGTNYCGWCEAEADRDAVIMVGTGALSAHEECQDERDALRERLAAADNLAIAADNVFQVVAPIDPKTVPRMLALGLALIGWHELDNPPAGLVDELPETEL